MPELPEVETIRRALAPHLRGRRVEEVIVRRWRLRWEVPRRIARELTGARVVDVERRAKYLLIRTEGGTAIVHLGMSGRLTLIPGDLPPGRHDHVDLRLEGDRRLRLHDPRRFGCLLWTRRDPARHPLLRDLGPEPLSVSWGGGALHHRARGRSVAIKNLLMNSRIVVGVGNIYASEALHRAGIHPARTAGRISLERCGRLADAVKLVLREAIAAGGTTLRDFLSAEGQPGLFKPRLAVYQRAGEGCPRCGARVRCTRLGQRSTFYCPRCQT